MNHDDQTPKHLQRYVPPPLGERGRFNPYDRVGLWAILGHIILIVLIYSTLLPRG